MGINSSSTMPRVSVLMTIYNAAPFLRASIDSLLAQSFTDWELIAIENGSTDDSPEILSGYQDPRIHVFSFPKNIGRTPALRRAFEEARGELIAVLDADDVSHPQRLEREAEFLDRHPDVVLVGSWARYIDKDGQETGRWEPPAKAADLYDRLAWLNPFAHSSVLFRRAAATAAGGYPAEYVFAQDYALFLSLVGQGRLAMIEDYLCELRRLSGSVTRSREYRLIIAREELVLMRKAAKILKLSPEGKRCNRRTVALCEFRYGRLIFGQGKAVEGLRMVACAFLRSLGWASWEAMV